MKGEHFEKEGVVMVCVNIMVNVVNVSGVVMMVKLVLMAKMLRLVMTLVVCDRGWSVLT